jgi:competence protein ComEC
LETPAVFDDFNYKNYLKKDGIYSVIYYPEVELLNRKSYRDPVSIIFDFKDRLRQVIYRFLSPPQSEILGGMILGDNNRMSQELKEKLNITGVRHITAVSGMNILIILGILMSLFLFLGFWRGQAFYISITAIWLFIVLIGFQASGVRAGIMASLLLVGRKIGRQSFSWRGIIIAAAIMLIINPMLLFYDVSFQLSFLATLGIISLGSSLKKWLKWDVLIMTVSAYVFTLPILIYNFGQISSVGLLVNLLIVPFVYWITILGFIFVLIGLFWQSLAWFLSFPVWLLLTYIIKIVDLFSQPWLAKNIENVHWFWLLPSYLFLAVFVYHLKSKKKSKIILT